MRSSVTIALLLVLGWATVSQAQVVSAYRPLGVPVQYVASPAASSSRVITTYYPGTAYPGTAQPVPVSSHTVLQPVTGATIVGSPINACACLPPMQTTYLPVRGYSTAVGYPGVIAYRPLIPLGSVPRSAVIGRGIVGQPTVYVPGQPVRNFLRYVSP